MKIYEFNTTIGKQLMINNEFNLNKVIMNVQQNRLNKFSFIHLLLEPYLKCSSLAV